MSQEKVENPTKTLTVGSTTGSGQEFQETKSVSVGAAYKLAAMDPDTVETALKARLEGLLGPHKASLIDGAKRTSGEFDVVGYGEIGLGQEDAKAAYEIVSKACAQAPREMILAGVTKSRLKCRKRGEDGTNEQAIIMAYVELFAPWPGDVAMKVIGKMHALEDGWWPSAASVEKELRFYGGARKSLMSALYDSGCRPGGVVAEKQSEPTQWPKKRPYARFKMLADEIIRRGYNFKEMPEDERNKIIEQVTADLEARGAEI